ncbi:MAG: Gfo/Idh/MocA family oxidoreductase, partial [Planctomycetes bacterium]|nr:Gfo/Idh/MocA family oxidoreductase [Planctomycetota bacterium]
DSTRRRPVRVGIGIAGMGFMGATHLLAARGLRGARVAASVTSDPRKARGDLRGVRGNFGEGAGKVDLRGIRVHPTFDDLLADPGVDLVDICLPSFLHAETAQRALAAGKHVLVEKPIALAPAAARRMISAAEKAGRLIMVAQVLKFFPEFKVIEDALRDGRWGGLLALHLRRRIARPDWGAGSWFADPKRSGGMVVDLHIHDTDFVVHLFGKPRAVSSQGLVRGGRVDFVRTVYHLAVPPGSQGRPGGRGPPASEGAPPPLVSAEAGWINAPGLPFLHGYDAFFERATLSFDSSRSPEPLLCEAKGPRALKLAAPPAFAQELQAAADAVRAGEVPVRLSAASAAASLEVCLAEERSARAGKMVTLARRAGNMVAP